MCHHIERLTVVDLFVFTEGQIAALAVDRLRGYIYWSDHGKHTISRAAIDGSNPEVIVNAGMFFYAIRRFSLCPYAFHLFYMAKQKNMGSLIDTV